MCPFSILAFLLPTTVDKEPFYLSLLKERILIMNLDHRDYGHVNLFHVVPDVVSLV